MQKKTSEVDDKNQVLAVTKKEFKNKQLEQETIITEFRDIVSKRHDKRSALSEIIPDDYKFTYGEFLLKKIIVSKGTEEKKKLEEMIIKLIEKVNQSHSSPVERKIFPDEELFRKYVVLDINRISSVLTYVKFLNILNKTWSNRMNTLGQSQNRVQIRSLQDQLKNHKSSTKATQGSTSVIPQAQGPSVKPQLSFLSQIQKPSLKNPPSNGIQSNQPSQEALKTGEKKKINREQKRLAQEEQKKLAQKERLNLVKHMATRAPQAIANIDKRRNIIEKLSTEGVQTTSENSVNDLTLTLEEVNQKKPLIKQILDRLKLEKSYRQPNILNIQNNSDITLRGRLHKLDIEDLNDILNSNDARFIATLKYKLKPPK